LKKDIDSAYGRRVDMSGITPADKSKLLQALTTTEKGTEKYNKILEVLKKNDPSFEVK